MKEHCMYFVYDLEYKRIVSCSDSLNVEEQIARRMYDCGFDVRVVVADIDISGIDFDKNVVNEYKHKEE